MINGSDLENLTTAADKAIGEIKGIFDYINRPKEEARQILVQWAQSEIGKTLSPGEAANLTINSRLYLKRLKNTNDISEKIWGKLTQINNDTIKENTKEIPETWLHTYFNRAQFISENMLQDLWAEFFIEKVKHPGTLKMNAIEMLSLIDDKILNDLKLLMSSPFICTSSFRGVPKTNHLPLCLVYDNESCFKFEAALGLLNVNDKKVQSFISQFYTTINTLKAYEKLPNFTSRLSKKENPFRLDFINLWKDLHNICIEKYKDIDYTILEEIGLVKTFYNYQPMDGTVDIDVYDRHYRCRPIANLDFMQPSLGRNLAFTNTGKIISELISVEKPPDNMEWRNYQLLSLFFLLQGRKVDVV